MMSFNPNAAAAADSGLFGLPFTEEESSLVIVPVPWEVTTSYGGGTSKGPEAIFEASKQVDLYDVDVRKFYEAGISLAQENPDIRELNHRTKLLAQQIIDVGGDLQDQPKLHSVLNQVNAAGERLNKWVYSATQKLLAKQKIVGILGGDHSVPFGAIQAIAEIHPSFGILHFDAHSDTRKAYEGFTWSHASIMYNVLEKIPQVKKLTQVGIRDVCEEEIQYIQSQKSRMDLFLDKTLATRQFEGAKWAEVCKDIVNTLPEKVWVSFDIDGLDPKFCPHTGTPVPGGLEFQQANYLLGTLVKSGREMIGFDLNEVAPNLQDESDEWDANVGARLLYKLSGWTLASQRKAEIL